MRDVRSVVAALEQVPKVYVPALPRGTVITLDTRNSRYHLTLLDPRSCLVEARGGYFERTLSGPCLTTVLGSCLGGSMIYRCLLVEGLLCEFTNTVITSPIRMICVAPST